MKLTQSFSFKSLNPVLLYLLLLFLRQLVLLMFLRQLLLSIHSHWFYLVWNLIALFNR